jgi:ovo-like protein
MSSYGGGGGGGVMGSGGGGGSMGGPGGNGGNGGRPNYGPSSPPTGSLPPFYESLKGNYVAPMQMECDTGQQGMQQQHQQQQQQQNNYDNLRSPKQYQLLQNVCASYGLVAEDENDDELAYSPKMPPDPRDPLPSIHLLGGGVVDRSYLQRYLADPSPGQQQGDPMMDIAGGDPLQFTATLTFSSPAEHALLESLTDAATAELFLRLPTSDDPLSPQPSSDTSPPQGPSPIPGPVEPNVQPFPEHCNNNNLLLSKCFDTSRNYPSPFGKSMFQSHNQQHSNDYHSLPKERPELALHISQHNDSIPPQLQQLQIQVQLSHQQQLQQQQSQQLGGLAQSGLLSPGLSFTGSGLDLTPSSLDSPTTMSLPSPGTPDSSVNAVTVTRGPASVGSSRRDSTASDISTLPTALQVRERPPASVKERVRLSNHLLKLAASRFPTVS